MDINSKIYYERALKLGLPVEVIYGIPGFNFTLSNRNYYFFGGLTPFNPGINNYFSNDKDMMNKILKHNGFPVPNSISFSRDWFLSNKRNICGLKFPVVAKPTAGTFGGRDVFCNIKSYDKLYKYLIKSFEVHYLMTVEEFHRGLNNYRVLVFYNEVIGVVKRNPAQVIGDGVNSIAELIIKENKIRNKLNKDTSIDQIKVDDEYKVKLEELGITLDHIPADKEQVILCYTCNALRGGTMVSLGRSICKENSDLLSKAAKALNLNIVGFDVVCKDINIPFDHRGDAIIEANHNPDVSIHENPLYGECNFVTKKIVKKIIYRHPFAYLRLISHKKLGIFIMLFKALLVVLIILNILYFMR